MSCRWLGTCRTRATARTAGWTGYGYGYAHDTVLPLARLSAAPRGIEALAAVQPSEFRRRLALTRFALRQRWWL